MAILDPGAPPGPPAEFGFLLLFGSYGLLALLLLVSLALVALYRRHHHDSEED